MNFEEHPSIDIGSMENAAYQRGIDDYKQKVREAMEKCEVIDQRGSEPIIRWIDKERFLKELGI